MTHHVSQAVCCKVVELCAGPVGRIYVFCLELGETEAKILDTTLTISAFSLTSLPVRLAHEQRRLRCFLSSLGLAVVGLLLYIRPFWAEWFDTEAVGKTMAIVGLFSFSSSQRVCFAGTPCSGTSRGLYRAVAAFCCWRRSSRSLSSIRMTLSGSCGPSCVAIWMAVFRCVVPILHKLGASKRSARPPSSINNLAGVPALWGTRDLLVEKSLPQMSLTIRVQVERVNSQIFGD